MEIPLLEMKKHRMKVKQQKKMSLEKAMMFLIMTRKQTKILTGMIPLMTTTMIHHRIVVRPRELVHLPETLMI